MMQSGVGFAVLAAVCNGSFSALAKCQRVQRAKVPSYTFNFWLCLGVCLASVPIAYGTALRCVCWQGIVSGCLFVLSTASSMQAIQLIGLSQAVGIGCGTAALVSFAFGALIETGSVADMPRALGGIACLLIGVALVSWAGVMQQRIAAEQQDLQHHQASPTVIVPISVVASAGHRHAASSLQQPLLLDSDLEHSLANSSSAEHQQCSADHRQPMQQQQQVRCRRTLSGVLLAVMTGVLGGLILAPMDHVGRECRGIPYQASLAVGVLVSAPIITYCLHWCNIRKVSLQLPMHPAAAAGPGLLAGIIWAAGITSSMLATTTIGLAITYPIMQSGLFIAGLWGILLYGELYSLKPHLAYWTGGVVLVVGILLVGGAGRQ